MCVQYELYIDVFFLVNFMMDFILLLLVRRVLKCTVARGRAVIGAVAGALLTCVLICLPIASSIKIICLHIFVNTSMILTGIPLRGIRELIKAWVWLYLSSFLLGGFLTMIYPYIRKYLRTGCFFFAVMIGSYYLIAAVISFVEHFWKLKETKKFVTLYQGEQILKVAAIIDSGNSLTDQLTGKPVHIIGKKTARALMQDHALCQVRYIPYCTIQKEAGVLPVITIEKMCIHGETDQEIKNPLLGISEQAEFAKGAYEMIIQPDSC